MSENLTPERKRILYRASYRGTKEADIVIGGFAKAHIGDLTDAELEEFRLLLEVPDQTLYGWIIGREEAPENYQGPILERLQAFNVAKSVTDAVS